MSPDLDPDLDPRTAGLETQLDRLDDARLEGVRRDADDRPAPDLGELDLDGDGFGLHVEGDGGPLTGGAASLDDDSDGLPTAVEAGDDVEVLDELVVAFNHRDLDDLVEVVAADGEAPGLLGYDRDNLAEAIDDLWTRRPTVQLTRGTVEDQAVGVLWEHDGDAWWRIAVACVDDVVDGRVGVLEFADDTALLDQIEASAPDTDLLEGERWREWDEGDDD